MLYHNLHRNTGLGSGENKMECKICKETHSFLHYPLQWMSEAEQDKRPIYKQIFNWKTHIMPITIYLFIILIFILIKRLM